MSKPLHLRHAVAKRDGFYSVNGEKLVGRPLSQEFCDVWNSVEKVAAPVVQEEQVVEPLAEEVEEASSILDKFRSRLLED